MTWKMNNVEVKKIIKKKLLEDVIAFASYCVPWKYLKINIPSLYSMVKKGCNASLN